MFVSAPSPGPNTIRGPARVNPAHEGDTSPFRIAPHFRSGMAAIMVQMKAKGTTTDAFQE